MLIIKSEGIAKNLLQRVVEKDFARFVGSKVGFCRTVDEGYFFIMGETNGYIGYTGPMEIPVLLKELKCD